MKKSIFILSLLILIKLGISQKPNILFIFSDDQSYETVAATGNTEIQTPNLDKLVNNGVTFTHTYNMGAWGGAICISSRLMINMGRFIWNAQSLNGSASAQNNEFNSGRGWAKELEKAGYDTYITGKWHLLGSATNSFQITSQVKPGFTGTVNASYDRPTDTANPYDTWSPYDESIAGFWTGGKHWSIIVAEEAEKFLTTAASDPDPFFMYVAFNAPHDPRQAPRSYVEKYPWQNIKVPPDFLPQYPNYLAIGSGPGTRDERLAPYPRTEFSVQVHRQEYYASIDFMDAQIGRILDALQASGKADNTYVMFTSDHGLAVGHHGFLGKQNLYEHSTRVPLMITGPGLTKRSISSRVYLQDVMPTTLELAGVSIPNYVDFLSLMPLIDGRKSESYDAIYGAFQDTQRSVTFGDYKLIYYPPLDRVLLFNLKEDPFEITNLVDDEEYAYILSEAWKKLQELQTSMGDDFNLTYVPPTPDPNKMGCMDSTYREYDGNATINNYDACITGIKRIQPFANQDISFKNRTLSIDLSDFQIELRDINGKVLMMRNYQNPTKIRIEYPPGLYIIRVKSPMGLIEAKFVF